MRNQQIRRPYRATSLLLILAVAFGGAHLSARQAVDVTGTWVFDVTTDAGGGMPTVTFQQDGEALTGHYSSDNLGEADLTGTVRGREINFSFEVDAQGFALDVTYAGTIEDDGTMQGSMSLGDVGSGTFTGKRE